MGWLRRVKATSRSFLLANPAVMRGLFFSFLPVCPATAPAARPKMGMGGSPARARSLPRPSRAQAKMGPPDCAHRHRPPFAAAAASDGRLMAVAIVPTRDEHADDRTKEEKDAYSWKSLNWEHKAKPIFHEGTEVKTKDNR